MHLPEGTLLSEGRYKIIEPPLRPKDDPARPRRHLGQGGFGITYLAEELYYYRFEQALNRVEKVANRQPQKVVIKEVFFKELCKRSPTSNNVVVDTEIDKQWHDLKRRLENEGKILSKFDHPNIVKVHSLFAENNTIYTVMEYVDSENLEELLDRKNHLPVATAIEYMKDVLAALSEIHSCQLYHFDVKPSNILIEHKTNKAVLIDFGTALSYNKDGSLNSNQSQLSKIKQTQGASVPFCPQEIEGGEFDYLHISDRDKPATIDLYSVGATLYQCITGNFPPRASYLAMGREMLFIPPGLAGEVDEKMLDIIAKAMETNVNKRFQSAGDFLRIFGVRVDPDPPPPPPPPPIVVPPSRPGKVQGLKWLWILLALIGLLLIIIYLL